MAARIIPPNCLSLWRMTAQPGYTICRSRKVMHSPTTAILAGIVVDQHLCNSASALEGRRADPIAEMDIASCRAQQPSQIGFADRDVFAGAVAFWLICHQIYFQ